MRKVDEYSYEPDCAIEWLELINDIAIGYDGYRDPKGLMELIDEMVEMNVKAQKCLLAGNIFRENT